MRKITVEELKITSGGNTVYGKMYKPCDGERFPAVILAHGYNGIHRDFVNECIHYAENGYAAYAFDFCGGSTYSSSTGRTCDMSVFTEKQDLLNVFDHVSSLSYVDENNVFLFGGSMGGLVSMLAAEERRDKVKGVAVYFPALCIPREWSVNFPDIRDIPEVVDFWDMRLGKIFFTSMRGFNVFEAIGKFSNPLLIIHGDRDEVVDIRDSERALEIYPDAEMIVLEGEGHGYTPHGNNIAMQNVLSFLKRNTY